MSLSGSFATMPFPDLLQWISEARKTGALSVQLDFEERILRIEDGSITGMESEDTRGRDLGQVCVDEGLLDEEALSRLVVEAERIGQPVATLLHDGRFPEARIDAALRAHVQRVVLGMFLWKEGRFHLGDIDSPLFGSVFGDELRLGEPLAIRHLIMEGMRRIDEWVRVVEVFPSDYCQVHALGRDPSLPILDELFARGEPVALGELWGRGGDRYRLYEDLFKAYNLGLLAVDAQVPVPAGDRLQHPLDVLVRNAEVLLEAQQFDEAASLLRTVLNFDASRVDARALLTRAREDQLAEMYQTIPPHKTPVLAMDESAIAKLPLTRRERHVASRVNGRWDVGALVVVTPLGELETMRSLRKLLHVGAVRLA